MFKHKYLAILSFIIYNKLQYIKKGYRKNMDIWLSIVLIIVALLVGAVIGFFITKKIFQKQIEKNPPISEAQIKEMFRQMGRTASEKQIKQIMSTMQPKKK